MIRLIHDSSLITQRYLRAFVLNPGRLIYPLVQPLVLLVLFISVFGGLALGRHGGDGSYREFLIPGIIIENAILTAPTTGLALLRDSASGLADRFRSLPMARSAVLIGRLLADAVIFAAQAALLLGAGSLLGFHSRAWPVTGPLIIAVAICFGLAFSVFSAWLAMLLKDPETAERVLFFPAVAVAFVSSAFAPVQLLAGWMRPVARANPVTAAADLIRSLAGTGGVATSLSHLAIWVAVLAVLPGILTVRRWQSAT